MKTKNILPIAIILAITLSLGSCKKYPEGPLISFRSAMTRICQKWKIQKFTVNGVDYTDSLSDIAYIYFRKKSAYPGPDPFYGIYFNPPLDTLNNTGGYFYLEDNEKKLLMSYIPFFSPNSYNKYPLSIKLLLGYKVIMENNAVRYSILKLRNNSMVLERDENGNHYRLELKPY